MAPPGPEDLPETQYAWAGDICIAHQVMGESGGGRPDLIFVPGIISHVEFFHEIEDDVGFPLFDGATNREDCVTDTEWLRLVAQVDERTEDVAFGFDPMEFRFAQRFDTVGRNEIFVHQDEHAKLLASGAFLALGLHRACQSLLR